MAIARPLSAIVVLCLVGFVLSGGLGTASGATDAGEVENVTVYRLSSLSDIDRATFEQRIANGSVRPADRAVIGDTLVLAIDSGRLAHALDSGDASQTHRFFDVLEDNATLQMIQTNPTPERPPKVASLGPENASVTTDGSSTYVFVNTSRLAFVYEGYPEEGRAPIYGEERFAVVFGFGIGDDPKLDHEAVDEVTFYPSRAAFWDTSSYRPLPPEQIELPVRIHVPPTRSLSIQLSLPENRTITATVPPDETWIEDAPMDLRGVEPGTPYELRLVYDGTVIDRDDGTVREPTATLSDVELTAIGNQAAVTLTANLSHGGGVVAMDEHCRSLALEHVEPGNATPMALTLYDQDGEMIPAESIDTLPVVVRARRGELATRRVYNGSSASVTFNTNATCPLGTDSEPAITTSTTPTTDSTTSPTDSSSRTTDSATSPTPGSTAGSDGGGTDDQPSTTTVPGFTFLPALLALLGSVALARWRP